MRRPRPVSLPAAPAVDTSQLSDVALYQHYRRTAPIEDLRFFLRVTSLPADVRADADSLLAAGCRDTGGAVARTEFYRRLTALQDRWRRATAYAAPSIAEPLAEAV